MVTVTRSGCGHGADAELLAQHQIFTEVAVGCLLQDVSPPAMGQACRNSCSSHPFSPGRQRGWAGAGVEARLVRLEVSPEYMQGGCL